MVAVRLSIRCAFVMAATFAAEPARATPPVWPDFSQTAVLQSDAFLLDGAPAAFSINDPGEMVGVRLTASEDSSPNRAPPK